MQEEPKQNRSKWCIAVLALLLVVSSCNKEDRLVKNHTKNLEGTRLWNGSSESSVPVIDSNGNRIGYKNNVTEIRDTVIGIAVVNKETIEFAGQDLRYDILDKNSNTITYKGSGSAKSTITYFIDRDSISYIYYIGGVGSLVEKLHTQ